MRVSGYYYKLLVWWCPHGKRNSCAIRSSIRCKISFRVIGQVRLTRWCLATWHQCWKFRLYETDWKAILKALLIFATQSSVFWIDISHLLQKVSEVLLHGRNHDDLLRNIELPWDCSMFKVFHNNKCDAHRYRLQSWGNAYGVILSFWWG